MKGDDGLLFLNGSKPIPITSWHVTINTEAMAASVDVRRIAHCESCLPPWIITDRVAELLCLAGQCFERSMLTMEKVHNLTPPTPNP